MSISSSAILSRVRDAILQESATKSDHTDADIYEYATDIEGDILNIALASDIYIERQELFGSLLSTATLSVASTAPTISGFTGYSLPSDYRATKIVYLSNSTQQRSYTRNEFMDETQKKGVIYDNTYFSGKGGVYFEGQYLMVRKPGGWAGNPTVQLTYVKTPSTISAVQQPEIGDAFKTALIYGTVARCFLKTQEAGEAATWDGLKDKELALIFGAGNGNNRINK